MELLKNNEKKYLPKLLVSTLGERSVQDKIEMYSEPYKQLITYYKCAIMEVETKFNVLNQEMSLRYDRNPIETIKSRLKTPESILEKLKRRNLKCTVSDIEENLFDIAGVRVICSFQSDIYMIADAFLNQDDITLVEKKDYIKNPKENGYRSLHLIVEIPIFLHDKKKSMKVEVQFRTISMDWWASLEHKIRYKKEIIGYNEIGEDLKECATIGALLDERMETIQQRAKQARCDFERKNT